MLASLAIRDIVLIDRLDLAFGPGLSVLTGETGAGKSILLDAFSLALGGRGDAGLVRRGLDQGQVSAAFDLPPAHPVHAILGENGVASEGEVILRRVQLADGRTRALVNDQPVGVALLRQIGASLVEIHGQHADRALVDPAAHRALLDVYAGLDGPVVELGCLHRAWRAAGAELEAARERVAKAASEADYLRHVVEELTLLAPEPGEEEHLAERRHAMMQAEKLAGELADVEEIVSGHASPVPALGAALRRLERKAGGDDSLTAPVAAAIDRALTALDEARMEVEEALRLAAFEPAELERIEERLFALRGAARKHDVSVDRLPALAETMARDLAEIDAGAERLIALAAAESAAAEAYAAAAGAVSRARHEAASGLDAAVMAELGPLKLDRARFETRIESDPAEQGGPEGVDRVAFWVQTNPGANPGPLMKVASGGELSRFLLALKVVLADRASAPTLVFDEIDTGVGGAVAEAIGQRLARLGGKVQVLSVTHAPQVAAAASSHYLINKTVLAGGESVATGVAQLGEGERREEIARMLAGARITDAARAAAAQLMAGGGG